MSDYTIDVFARTNLSLADFAVLVGELASVELEKHVGNLGPYFEGVEGDRVVSVMLNSLSNDEMLDRAVRIEVDDRDPSARMKRAREIFNALAKKGVAVALVDPDCVVVDRFEPQSADA